MGNEEFAAVQERSKEKIWIRRNPAVLYVLRMLMRMETKISVM
jgi:hypothetical protein